MAKLPPERQALLWDLKQRLLDILDEARGTELELLKRFGETDETIAALEQLTEITLQAKDRFSQLSVLQVGIAEAQPTASSDLLKLLDDRIGMIESRIPALERSTQEIKLDWNL